MSKCKFPDEVGEEYRSEFEREYGKDRKTGYGQWIDTTRMYHGRYRSMVTHFAWAAYRHGKGCYNPNIKEE